MVSKFSAAQLKEIQDIVGFCTCIFSVDHGLMMTRLLTQVLDLGLIDELIRKRLTEGRKKQGDPSFVSVREVWTSTGDGLAICDLTWLDTRSHRVAITFSRSRNADFEIGMVSLIPDNSTGETLMAMG